jgi:tetratricopeptide (TPR) repeat protein
MHLFKRVYLYILLLLTVNSVAQNTNDSILSMLREAPATKRQELMLKVAEDLIVSKPDQAFELANNVYKNSANGNAKDLSPKALLIMGRALLRQEKFNEAFDQFTLAKQQFRKQSNKEGQAKSIMFTGDIYGANADYSSALQKYTEAFALASADFSMRDFSDHLWRLGSTCLKLSSNEKAEDYFNNGFESAKRYRNSDNMIKCLNGMGEVNLKRLWLDSALDDFSNAMRIARQYNSVSGLTISLNYLGETYIKMGKHLLAMPYFKEGLKYAELSGDRYHQSIIKSNLGDAYMGMKEAKKAAEQYTQSGTYATELKNDGIRLNEYIKSAEAARELGNDMEARQFDLLARVLEDSLRRHDSNERQKRVQALYEKEKRVKQVELGQMEQERLSLLARIAILLVIILSVLGAVVVYFMLRYKKQNKELKDNLNVYSAADNIKERFVKLYMQLMAEHANYEKLWLPDMYAFMIYSGFGTRAANAGMVNLHKVCERIKSTNKSYKISNLIKPDCIALADEKFIETALQFSASYIYTADPNCEITIQSRSFEPRIELIISSPAKQKPVSERSDLLLALSEEMLERSDCKLTLDDDGQLSISWVMQIANLFDGAGS